MDDAFTELGFTIESCDGSLLVAELVAKHLEGHLAVHGMLGTIDDRSAAFTNETFQRVAGD